MEGVLGARGIMPDVCWVLQCIAREVNGKREVAGVHWDYDCYGAPGKIAQVRLYSSLSRCQCPCLHARPCQHIWHHRPCMPQLQPQYPAVCTSAALQAKYVFQHGAHASNKCSTEG